MTNGSAPEPGPANPVFWNLYQEGRYAEALVAGQQGLDLARHHVGKSHPGLAIPLNEVATAHCQMGNYAQAQHLYLEAIELLREAPGEFRRPYAVILQNL